VPIIRGDDRQRLVPESVVRVLTHLIDEFDAPSHVRVELRSLRARLCRLYRIEDPQSTANEVAVMQQLAEDDGIPTDD